MSYIRYKIEKQQVSYDSGVTWTDTSVTRNGEYVGTYSTLSECEAGGDIPYSGQYFTIESAVDNNVVWFVSFSSRTISASTDGGSTWSGYTTSENSGIAIATLNTGQKVLVKGLNSRYNDYSGTTRHISNFDTSGNYIVYGNIMSLVYGDSFATATTLTGDYNFAAFFSGKNKLISAENLILGATVLTSNCYETMFLNCTSLTTAPQLPATTLTEYCYSNMFNGCTSLTTAPDLPATTLTERCYEYMFQGCTSLTAAPELPATTLTQRCYRYMFNGCTNLNYIKAMFTTPPSTTYTYNWVNGVASSGTFVKNSAATWDLTGHNGIPEGWTVQNA